MSRSPLSRERALSSDQAIERHIVRMLVTLSTAADLVRTEDQAVPVGETDHVNPGDNFNKSARANCYR